MAHLNRGKGELRSLLMGEQSGKQRVAQDLEVGDVLGNNC